MSVGKRESDIELGEGSLPPPPAFPPRPSTQTPRSSLAPRPAAASPPVTGGAAGAGAPSSPVADPPQARASWTGSRPPRSALAGRRSGPRAAGPAENAPSVGREGTRQAASDPPRRSCTHPARELLCGWTRPSTTVSLKSGAAARCKPVDTVEQAPAQQVGQEASAGRGPRARRCWVRQRRRLRSCAQPSPADPR